MADESPVMKGHKSKEGELTGRARLQLSQLNKPL